MMKVSLMNLTPSNLNAGLATTIGRLDRVICPLFNGTILPYILLTLRGFLRHRCYGEKWAQQFDKVCWARLFSRFDVTATDGQQLLEPLWGSGFGTSYPVNDEKFWMKVRPKSL